MTLNTRVQAAVDKAFKKLDSLAVDAVFTLKAVTGFNFSNDTLVSADTSFTARGFVEETTKKVEKEIVAIKKLTIKTNNAFVMSGYSKVTINSQDYYFKVMESNPYTITFELTKFQ